MNSPRLEAFLARLYVEDDLRERFLAEPRAVALVAGLDAQEAAALADIDKMGLRVAAESFATKRRHKAALAPRPGWLVRTRGAVGARWEALAAFLHRAGCR